MSDKTVLIVDDSAVIRGMITNMLKDVTGIKVIGSASNGQMAADMHGRLKPDIVLMDIEMPVMDGIEALTKILEKEPDAQVIMCSTLTHKNAEISLKAMQIGAIDYIAKPTTNTEINTSEHFKENLIRMVKAIPARAVNNAPSDTAARPQTPASPAGGSAPNNGAARPSSTAATQTDHSRTSVPKIYAGDFTLRAKPIDSWRPKVLAIGSSTGGPQALFSVLKKLAGLPMPIIITQHMPATFTNILAQHISTQTGIPCEEGADNIILEAGKAYIAPGGKHMTFKLNEKSQIAIKLDDGPAENFCKPAVDPMLRSITDICGGRILCAILTGMGHDGLEGARSLTEKGGFIYAQDAASSVVWGMPGAVTKAGLCSAVLPVDQIGDTLRKICLG